MVPSTQTHGKQGYLGSMHGVARNCVDHTLACLELYGSLMEPDPGGYWFSFDHWQQPRSCNTVHYCCKLSCKILARNELKL